MADWDFTELDEWMEETKSDPLQGFSNEEYEDMFGFDEPEENVSQSVMNDVEDMMQGEARKQQLEMEAEEEELAEFAGEQQEMADQLGTNVEEITELDLNAAMKKADEVLEQGDMLDQEYNALLGEMRDAEGLPDVDMNPIRYPEESPLNQFNEEMEDIHAALKEDVDDIYDLLGNNETEELLGMTEDEVRTQVSLMGEQAEFTPTSVAEQTGASVLEELNPAELGLGIAEESGEYTSLAVELGLPELGEVGAEAVGVAAGEAAGVSLSTALGVASTAVGILGIAGGLAQAAVMVKNQQDEARQKAAKITEYQGNVDGYLNQVANHTASMVDYTATKYASARVLQAKTNYIVKKENKYTQLYSQYMLGKENPQLLTPIDTSDVDVDLNRQGFHKRYRPLMRDKYQDGQDLGTHNKHDLDYVIDIANFIDGYKYKKMPKSGSYENFDRSLNYYNNDFVPLVTVLNQAFRAGSSGTIGLGATVTKVTGTGRFGYFGTTESEEVLNSGLGMNALNALHKHKMLDQLVYWNDGVQSDALHMLHSRVKTIEKVERSRRNLFSGENTMSINPLLGKNKWKMIETVIGNSNKDMMVHFKQQAENDVFYKQALAAYQKSLNINASKAKQSQFDARRKEILDTYERDRYRLDDGLTSAQQRVLRDQRLAELEREIASASNYDVGDGFGKRLPFWVMYYNKNRKRFRANDMQQIERRRLQEKARRLVPDKERQPVESGDGNKRRNMRPVTPVPPPQPVQEETSRQRRRIRPFNWNLHQENPKYRGLNAKDDWSFNQSKTSVVKFSFMMAEHLAKIAGMTYDYDGVHHGLPSIPGYEVVQFIGSDKLFASATGLAMYNPSADIAVIALRGTRADVLLPLITAMQTFEVYQGFHDFQTTGEYIGLANSLAKLFNRYITNQLGDKPLADIFTDLDARKTIVGGINVHNGFATYVEQVYDQVKNFLSHNTKNTTKVFFCGHSLGGATTDLLRYRLVYDNIINPMNAISYTIGSPRWCSALDVEEVNKLCPATYRITNTRDIVPHVPTAGMGFKHVGVEYNMIAENRGEFKKYPRNFDSRDGASIMDVVNFFREVGAEHHGVVMYELLLKSCMENTTGLGISHQNPYSKLSTVGEAIDEGGRAYTKSGNVYLDSDGERYLPHFYMGNMHLQAIPKEYILGFYLYDSKDTREGLVIYN